jgi:hypothetical protein
MAGNRELCVQSPDNIDGQLNRRIAAALCNISDFEWEAKMFARLKSCLDAMNWTTIRDAVNALMVCNLFNKYEIWLHLKI